MDPVMNQLARELADVIADAVSGDAHVQACREKARAAGFDLRVSLEAAVTFVPMAPAGGQSMAMLVPVSGVRGLPAARPPFEMTATDRRFLKSLRISADEPAEREKEVE